MSTTIQDKYLDDAVVGQECISPAYHVTEARVMAYADLTGDHTPVHTDEAYAKTTPFGTRVAHGLFGLSVADGLKTISDLRFQPGMSLGWEWSFVGPIKLDDTVRVRFDEEARWLVDSGAIAINELMVPARRFAA